MTLLSAVVLGTDIFALPHRELPCTGAFVLMCAQVNVCAQRSMYVSVAYRELHSSVNDKSMRNAQPLEDNAIRLVWNMQGCVIPWIWAEGAEEEDDVACFQPLFSCKLLQTRFVSRNTAALSATGMRMLCNRGKIHMPLAEETCCLDAYEYIFDKLVFLPSEIVWTSVHLSI